MERRDFIKQSSIAAAGLAILPAGSIFSPGKERIKLGFIGVGGRGRSHIGEALLRSDT